MNFLELQAAVAAKKFVIAEHHTAAREHQLELNDLLKQCTHDEFNMEYDYTEGGYDYRSESRRWNQCTLCGRKTDMEIKYGNYS